jgi:CheY-like chemotaxis protein
MKVLIADDDLLIRTMLGDLLQELGHHVMVASNGAEAVELCGRERPDAVFLDFLMPKLSGLDALRAIRANGCKALVVVLTAISDRNVRAMQGNDVPDAILEKPIRRKAVEKVLARVGATA